MKPRFKLDNWSVGMGRSNPFRAPECCKVVLQGQIREAKNLSEDHDRFEWYERHIAEGSQVTIGTIVNVSGRVIETKNSIYVLGVVDPKYRKWLKENNIPFNRYNPIKS